MCISYDVALRSAGEQRNHHDQSNFSGKLSPVSFYHPALDYYLIVIIHEYIVGKRCDDHPEAAVVKFRRKVDREDQPICLGTEWDLQMPDTIASRAIRSIWMAK